MTITYGPPCFQDGSTRSITVKPGKVFFRTVYAQGMKEGFDDPDEAVLTIFEEYRGKLKGNDKKLFKQYFDDKTHK